MRDRHHVLFPKRLYNTYQDSMKLRQNPSLIIEMDRDAHEELHRNVPLVPILGQHALEQVRAFYVPDDSEDPIRHIEALQRAIEHSKRHPRTHHLEKIMADLTLHALDIQKPYIDYSY